MEAFGILGAIFALKIISSLFCEDLKKFYIRATDKKYFLNTLLHGSAVHVNFLNTFPFFPLPWEFNWTLPTPAAIASASAAASATAVFAASAANIISNVNLH